MTLFKPSDINRIEEIVEILKGNNKMAEQPPRPISAALISEINSGPESVPPAGNSGRSDLEGGVLRRYSPLQHFLLNRLSLMQGRRTENLVVLGVKDWRMKALSKALYSTYRDCVDASVGEEAKQLIAPKSASQ